MNKVKFKCKMGKLRVFKNCFISTCWKLAQTGCYLPGDTMAHVNVTEWKRPFPAKVFAGDSITRCHCTTVGKGSGKVEPGKAPRQCGLRQCRLCLCRLQLHTSLPRLLQQNWSTCAAPVCLKASMRLWWLCWLEI